MKNSKTSPKQTRQILATVVMGMNLVNTMAPAVALAAAPQPQALPQPQRQQTAKSSDYELLPALAGYVDKVLFSPAEAAITTNGSVATLGNGDVQHVVSKNESDKTGSVGTINYCGTQNISAGGTGTVSVINISGQQTIYSGGTGTVGTISGGTQTISSGGTGTVSTVSGGTQNVSSGGTGTVGTINSGGTQNVSSGGTGSVSVINISGNQTISSGGTGTVSVINISGQQYISSGGTGTVSTMSGGQQWVYGGTGTVSTISSGGQAVMSGGTGTVITMKAGGGQTVLSGTGTVITMSSGGAQYIYSGCTGTVSTMSGYCRQTVEDGGTGTVVIMGSGCTQYISSCGTGTVITMNSSGRQWITSGGTGTVGTMIDGFQLAQGGTGMLSTMSGGTQQIVNGAGTVGTMNGGSQIIYINGIGIVGTMSGGSQFVDTGGTGTVSALIGGLQLVKSGGTGTVSALIDGEQIVKDGGTAADTNIKGGMQTVSSGGTANATVVSGGVQYIQNGAVISGTEVKTDGVLRLAQDGDSAFALTNALTINGGTIDMTDGAAATALGRSVRAGATPAYQSLTVSDLQGTGGKLLMDTDLANNTGDTLTVDGNNNGTGSYGISVKDLSAVNGTEVTGEHKLLLVTDNSEKLQFTGAKENFGGLWDVDPTLEQDGKYWYLTKLAKTVNNDTSVLLDAADNSYALWRNTNDSLRSRLGALGNGSEQADGVWARTQAGRFSGDNYEGRYNMYQFGYDKADNAKSIYGVAVDYGDGTGSYADGSGKDKLKTFSLYGVWTGDSGTYTNVTARYGIVSTDLESYGDFPDKAAYKEHAYSVSVEYGKRLDLESGLFFEPNAQFTLGRLGGISYTTDRGANGNIDGMNSAIGRIGFVLGQKVTGGSDIYLKADLLHEFAGERDLQLTSDAGGTNDILNKRNDYGDTWFELGLGGNVKISKTGNFYGEVTRGFGGDINKKWSINAGLRFEF